MDLSAACAKLSDKDLTLRLKDLVSIERRATAALVAHLAEFDRRRLYADAGCTSLFVYCTRRLGYSESEAYRRITTARVVRKIPPVLSQLESGTVHMTAVVLLAPHLTSVNHEALLKEARGVPKRRLEFMIANLAPSGPKRDWARPAVFPQSIAPFAPERVRIGFDASAELLAELDRAREVLRHKYPAGRLEDIFKEALDVLLDHKDPERKLKAKEERARAKEAAPPKAQADGPPARYIPQAVKDAVWRRDGGRCVFKGPDGAPCAERGNIEIDHIRPWSLGGASDDPNNLRLLCREHNQLLARRVFGDRPIDKSIKSDTI